MLFNSYVFVLVFLPICLIGYFTLNHFQYKETAKCFLLGMSLWFYGFFNVRYLLIIIVSIVFNYIFSTMLEHLNKQNRRKAVLLLGLLFNLGLLFYFKYFDFFLDNLNFIFKSEFALRNIVLPLGISFFTFQQISYIIDFYRGGVPHYRFLDYALFVSFFPQLIAGPIVTHEELVPQLRDESRKCFDWENFVRGVYIFTLGLAKKVLLADTFGNAVNIGFSDVAGLDTTNAVIVMLAYTIQIYFDFSGYCDMAVGAAKMLNIELPVNFDSPYKAFTVAEFWKRWHITLTRFFTKYVYIPLGGNRKGQARTYLHVMIVFCVSGLWHGANWTFIMWGACHGLFVVINRAFKGYFEKLHPALNWLITFSFLNVTWVVFRADTIRDAVRLLNRIVQLKFGVIDPDIIECFNLPEFRFLLNQVIKLPILKYYPGILLLAFFVVSLLIILGSENAYERMERFRPTMPRLIRVSILMVWCIFSFSGVSTFLYFNF